MESIIAIIVGWTPQQCWLDIEHHFTIHNSANILDLSSLLQLFTHGHLYPQSQQIHWTLQFLWVHWNRYNWHNMLKHTSFLFAHGCVVAFCSCADNMHTMVLDFCVEERQAFVEPTFTFCFLLLALTFTFYFSLDPGIWGPIFETLLKFNWYDSGWWRCQLNTDNATWWPNLQSVQVAPPGGQNCNPCYWHHLVTNICKQWMRLHTVAIFSTCNCASGNVYF